MDLLHARAVLDNATHASRRFELWQHLWPSCLVGNNGEHSMGEVHPSSLAMLVRRMPAVCRLQPKSSVFVDVGSGHGQVPLFVRAAMGVRSIGIEVNRCRHAVAERRHESVRDVVPSGLLYFNDDVRTMDLSNATHLYMHSTCFSAGLVSAILDRATDAGVRCILDGGHGELRPALEHWGVPVAEAPTFYSWTRAEVPLFYYVRRGVSLGTHTRLQVDQRLYRERAKLATFGLAGGCGHDEEDPVIG